MKNAAIVSLVICYSLLATPVALAQTWTSAQIEVWKNVEAYSSKSAAGDLEGFLSYVHEDYIGWDIREPMTTDKVRLRKWIDFNIKNYKIELNDIQPLAINVVDDVAIVHYYFTVVSKDSADKRTYSTGRWADILKKQRDKWVLIGDHGGVTSEE